MCIVSVMIVRSGLVCLFVLDGLCCLRLAGVCQCVPWYMRLSRVLASGDVCRACCIRFGVCGVGCGLSAACVGLVGG